MNARLRKKKLNQMMVAGLSLPLTVNHALPSFFALDVPRQRNLLRFQMMTFLNVAPDTARAVVRRHWPYPPYLPKSAVQEL